MIDTVFPSIRLPLTARRRLWLSTISSAAAVFAILGFGAQLAPAARIPLPDATSGIHVALPFVRCYREMWATTAGTHGCREAAASPVQRLNSSPVDLGWIWNA